MKLQKYWWKLAVVGGLTAIPFFAIGNPLIKALVTLLVFLCVLGYFGALGDWRRYG